MQCFDKLNNSRDTQSYRSSAESLNFAAVESNTQDLIVDSKLVNLPNGINTVNDSLTKTIQESVSGKTCEPSEGSQGSSSLWWVEALARTTLEPTPKVKDLQAHALGFGGNNSESFKSADPQSLSGRIPQDADTQKEVISFPPLEPFCGRLKPAGMCASGNPSELVMLERHTKEIASSLLPTPLTCSSDSELYRRPGRDRLEGQLKLLPTPVTRDRKDSRDNGHLETRLQPLIPQDHVSHPHIREWMMGLPLNSTRITAAAGGHKTPSMEQSPSPNAAYPTEAIALPPLEIPVPPNKLPSAGSTSITSLDALSLAYLQSELIEYQWGADGVGRGNCAGLNVWAVCGIPKGVVLGGVRDSKKTNRQQRVKLAAKIHESCVVGLGVATPAEIDDLGINQAEKLALSRAIAHIRAQGHEPTDVIGDLAMPAIVGVSTTREKSADDKHPEASAASIAAKYALDLYWERVNEHYPNYGFLAHAGYVQPPHLEAMNRFGWIPGIHRLSYKPCREKAAAPTLRQAQCNAAADQLNTQGEYRMVASISPEVVAVLENAAVEGNTIKLNSPQLDRKLYVKVNEILERIGGKWKGGKVSAHVFENDPTDLLQSVLDSGDLPDKNPLAFFGTPPDLATRVAKSFKPENVAKGVLEPSAGEGALALAVRDLYPDAQIDCVEIDSSRAKKLKTLGFNTIEGDFLQVDLGRKYGVIVMNPPFSVKGDNLAYLTHIEKAFSLLKEGGQLIAIAPNGLAFNNQKRVQEFRALVQEHGNWEELEEGAFKASGTGVSTALVSIKKPEPPVTVLKQTLDYSSFPSDESIQAKSEKAQLIRDQILAVDSEADYAELRTNPNLTREQLNWVRENLITKEERKALAQRIRANPLPKPVAVGDVVCDRQGEVIGIVTKAMVTFLEIGDTKLSWEDFETQGLTKQILDEQNQPEIAEPLAPTEIVATSDAEELSQIETEIEEIQKSAWAEIGQRLKRIREGKLYKAKGYSNWDTYCRDRWNYGKSYANDLINAVKAQEILTGTAVILDNPNQAVPIRKMVNAGIESNQIQELVQEIAGSGNLTAEIIEQAAQDKGLLPTAKPKKQPTPIVAAAQSVGLSGKETQQLPDVPPNADIPPEELRPSLLACFDLLEITDFIRARHSDAIAEFVALGWRERFRMRALTQGTIDNQLMANASESQCRQVIGLIDQDKDSKIQYLEALFIEKEQVVSDYWDEIIKVRNERDELAKRVKQLETELGKPSVAA